jgi:hypothetical protein
MRIALAGVGVLIVAAGILFALQGFGFVHGSPMTNTTTWSILGPIIAVIGLILVVIGLRPRRP